MLLQRNHHRHGREGLLQFVSVVQNAVNGSSPSGGQGQDFRSGLDLARSNRTSIPPQVLSGANHDLHGETKTFRAPIILDLNGLQHLQKRMPLIPWHTQAGGNHVIAFQGAHGNESDFRQSHGRNKIHKVLPDALEHRGIEADEVHGLSEIEGEKKKSIDEIMRTVHDNDMRSCRFLFTTRPVRGIPSDVPALELLPLNLAMIDAIFLPSRTDLVPEQRDQVIRQLGIFRDDQIDPLLLTLAIDDSSDPSISDMTSGLFTRYFRRLLRLESSDQETAWQAWKFVLEIFADWFMLSPGKRGVGLQHRQLVQHMTAYEGTGTLLGSIQAVYGLSFPNENSLLDHLASARILEKGARWRFQHDLFEEYFAASRIVALVEDGRPLVLNAWSGASPADFANVIDFIKQFASADVLNLLIRSELPKTWRDKLSEHDIARPQ
jgi:hypothetical protein